MSFSAGALVPQAEVVKAKAKPSLVLKQQYGARKLVTKSVNPRYKEFGHDKNTTAYWTNDNFQGDAEEGDYASVTAILNYIYTRVRLRWLSTVLR